MNDALLGLFFPPTAAFSPLPRLRPHKTAPPLTVEEIVSALSQSSPSLALGTDGIPYLTWKQVNASNPNILLQTLSGLITIGYHLASLKVANGLVLNTPGKPFYQSPSSFKIIVVLPTITKILERIVAAHLLIAARTKGLIHPNQCGSLPGLSTDDI